MNNNLVWAVIATKTAENNGKSDTFDQVIATFNYLIHAEDFIEKCLPPENRSLFRIEAMSKQPA